jgi:hypothetical protein
MKNNVLIIDRVIEDRGIIDFLINELMLMESEDRRLPVNTFVKKNDVFKKDDNEFLNALKQVIGKVWYDVAYDLLATQESSLVGFEIWNNALPAEYTSKHLAGGNGGLNYHVDKDENALPDLVLPLYATTFYLSPEKGEMNGGAIYIDTNGLESYEIYKQGEKVLNMNTDTWVKIPFKPNRMIIFDPSYPHFVEPIIDIKQGKKRLGLQINPWDKELSEKKKV